jgi:hypothetical protein
MRRHEQCSLSRGGFRSASLCHWSRCWSEGIDGSEGDLTLNQDRDRFIVFIMATQSSNEYNIDI